MKRFVQGPGKQSRLEYYLGSAGGANKVEFLTHVDWCRGHLEADWTFQLLLLGFNLSVDEF